MTRLLAVCLILVFSGCSAVVCDNDPAGPNGEAAVFEPKLVGDWSCDNSFGTSESPPPESHLRIERASKESKDYAWFSLEVVQQPDGTSREEKTPIDSAAFPGWAPPLVLKAGKWHFLTNRTPANPELGTPETSSVDKIARLDDELHLSFMKTEFFDKHPDAIEHEREDKSIRITASAEKLREFLEHYGDNPTLWSKPEKAFWRRKPTAAK
jgi:hypothetical protein